MQQESKVSIIDMAAVAQAVLSAVIGGAIMAAVFYSDSNVAKANMINLGERVTRISAFNADVNADQEKRLQVLEKTVTRTETMVEFLYRKQGGK